MSSTNVTTTTKTNLRFHRELTASDPTIPYRIVGSYEYQNALDQFDRLVEISTPLEIQVYDAFLATRPEFTYYNGVNTAFKQPPDLTAADPRERARFNDQFQKAGLAWMMALARAEVGATLSMYSNDVYPFESTVNKDFGLESYVELLIDDATAHLKSLAGEAKFREVLDLRHRVDTWSLAYLRRLKVIKDMLTTIARASGQQRASEMKPLYDNLAGYETALAANVARWLSEYSQTTEKSTTKTVTTPGHVTASFAECKALLNRLKNSPNR